MCNYTYYYNPWQFVSFLQGHMERCEFVTVDCPFKKFGCIEVIAKRSLDEHIMCCQYVPHRCANCNKEVGKIMLQVWKMLFYTFAQPCIFFSRLVEFCFSGQHFWCTKANIYFKGRTPLSIFKFSLMRMG